MDIQRYNQIKDFMNGRDVSQSYCDTSHNSSIDFSEFVLVSQFPTFEDYEASLVEEELPITEEE